MLASSSKRARSSIDDGDVLAGARAAATSASTMGERSAGAVQRLLDRQHRRIGRRLPQQVRSGA